MAGVGQVVRRSAIAVPVVVDAAGTAAAWVVILGVTGRWAPAMGLTLAGTCFALTVSDVAGRAWIRHRYEGHPFTVQEQSALAEVITWLSRAGLGPPMVQLYVTRRQTVPWPVRPVGRRAVVMSPALVRAAATGAIPARQVAAVLGHVAGQAGRRRARFLPAGDLLTMPWQAIRAAAAAVGRGLLRFPLLRLAWSTRWIVAGTALVQSARDGHPVIGALAATIIALTYTLPRARAARARHLIDRALRDVAPETVEADSPPAPTPQRTVRESRPALGHCCQHASGPAVAAPPAIAARPQ